MDDKLDFIANGYLAGNITPVAKDFDKKYSEYFNFLTSLNKCGQRLSYNLVYPRGDSSKIVSAMLYAHVLSTYQAIVLLSKKGMKHQVKILFRGLLEALFPLVAISKEASFVNRYLESDDIQSLKDMNSLISTCKKRKVHGKELENIKKLAKEQKKKNDASGPKKLTAQDAADAAELRHLYDPVYGELSSAAHATPRSLYNSLEPDVHDLEDLISLSAESLLFSIQAISKIFELEEDKEIKDNFSKLRELDEKHLYREQNL